MDSSRAKPGGKINTADQIAAAAMAAVSKALGQLRFGAIELIVHDGKVVQIDVTERQRFS